MKGLQRWIDETEGCIAVGDFPLCRQDGQAAVSLPRLGRGATPDCHPELRNGMAQLLAN